MDNFRYWFYTYLQESPVGLSFNFAHFLDNASPIGLFSFLAHSLAGACWDHLPIKLLALELLFQGQPLEETKLR